MTRVTRRYKFAASHRLHSGRFSEEENRELYGKSNNPYGHGHDYVLDVSVTDPVDAASGQVVNIQVLDRLGGEQIVHDFDQNYRHAAAPQFATGVPTCD